MNYQLKYWLIQWDMDQYDYPQSEYLLNVYIKKGKSIKQWSADVHRGQVICYKDQWDEEDE